MLAPDFDVPFEGGCACGAVRYVSTAAPVWSANCHCHACQAGSGAPYVSAISVPAHSVTVTGERIAFTRTSASGHAVTTSLCAICGTRIHAQSEGNTILLNLFASTLDKPESFTPISNVYVSEKAHWVTLDPDIPAFEKMPG